VVRRPSRGHLLLVPVLVSAIEPEVRSRTSRPAVKQLSRRLSVWGRMRGRITARFLSLICVAMFASGVLCSNAGAVAVGISDNGAAMFSQPSFQRLNIRYARDVVFWNVAVMRNKRPLDAIRGWINAAQQAGVTPLISFGGNGNYIPSWRVYAAAIRAFLHDFPSVKTYTPWNEPDWIYRPALARHPQIAADYFNVLIRWCHRCTIAAGDVYLPAPQLGPWLRTYRRYLHARPRAWALHNYYDVREHNTRQLQALYDAVHPAQIWLTEIGGVERRGHWQFRNQGVFAAARDERYLFWLPNRFHRVTRIYHYQWQGTLATRNTGWDSGLIGPLGGPRPAYWTLAHAAGPRPEPKP
jgi:Glycosyl hydrolase catalytic core